MKRFKILTYIATALCAFWVIGFYLYHFHDNHIPWVLASHIA